MIESGATGKFTNSLDQSSNRQRSTRLDEQAKRETRSDRPTVGEDTLELSPESASRDASAEDIGREQRVANDRPNQPPIESEEESSNIVRRISQNILGNAGEASLAQGGLNQERILDLIA